jgi:NADH dehydrogenase
VILRPSIVFGPGDGFFGRFAGLARLLPFMPVISGTTRFQPVYVGDVADAVLASLARPEAAGQVFELGGPRVWTFRELLAFIVQQTGRRRPLLDIPMGLARVQARLGELLPNPPLTRDQLILLGRDNVVASGRPGLASGDVPEGRRGDHAAVLRAFRGAATGALATCDEWSDSGRNGHRMLRDEASSSGRWPALLT